MVWGEKEGMSEVAGRMKRPGNMGVREKTFGGKTGITRCEA